MIPGRALYPANSEARKIQLSHHKTAKRPSYPHQWTQSHLTTTNNRFAINKSNTLWRKHSNQLFLFALRRWQECFLWKHVWLCLSTEGSLWIVDKKHVLPVGIVCCLASYVLLLLSVYWVIKHRVRLHLLQKMSSFEKSCCRNLSWVIQMKKSIVSWIKWSQQCFAATSSLAALR